MCIEKIVNHVLENVNFSYHADKNGNQVFEKMLNKYLKNVDQAFEKC